MVHEWTTFVQEEVQAEQYIPFPAEVRAIAGYDHELHGPSVHWNYERNAGYVVLSNYQLRGSNYVDVGRYSVYDVEAGDDGGGRIRPPGSLDGVIKSNFLPGTRVVYLAYREMVESENPTVYLLSDRQFRSLLPQGARDVASEGTADDEIREALFDLPAFLPSP